MALHSPGAPTTLHRHLVVNGVQAQRGNNPIKAELVLLMHMISTMPTDMDPFSVSTSRAVDLGI